MIFLSNSRKDLQCKIVDLVMRSLLEKASILSTWLVQLSSLAAPQYTSNHSIYAQQLQQVISYPAKSCNPHYPVRISPTENIWCSGVVFFEANTKIAYLVSSNRTKSTITPTHHQKHPSALISSVLTGVETTTSFQAVCLLMITQSMLVSIIEQYSALLHSTVLLQYSHSYTYFHVAYSLSVTLSSALASHTYMYSYFL